MTSPTHKEKTYAWGIKAEKMAATYLKTKSYRVLEERYKTPYGEIDLIVCKKNIIAFVEVKARQTKEQALESITVKMRQRISNAALHYISQNEAINSDYRFDVIAVNPPFSIHHLENAWMMDT